VKARSAAVNSVIRLFVTIGAAVFVGEMLVMLVLEELSVQSEFGKALVDSTLLLGLIFPVLYLTIFRPLTGKIAEHQRTQAALRVLNEHLERSVEERTKALLVANQELGSFAYTVSHDLRAPLRALDGYSRMVLETEAARLSDEGRDMLGQIHVYAEKMSALIDDVMQFAQAGRYELRMDDVDMAALAHAVVDEQQSAHPAAQIVVAELPHVTGDATMLKQVWANLIENALKFSSKNDQPRVTIGTVDSKGQTAFYVKDNGVGFDMAYAGKLFELFRRMHASEDFPGTGAGLAITKRIVERHGGNIWVESRPGDGATFFFTLGDT
jgi:light-regulated signal transduction histidine kinase (bacteriophytochrome)